jgi:O-succinylbenzoic acid--CoA ligase
LLGLSDQEGRTGWGDAAPWPGFGSGTAPVEEEFSSLLNENSPLFAAPISSPQEVGDWVAREIETPEIAYAVEVALLDLLGQAQNRPIHSLLGGALADRVFTHHLVTQEEMPPSRWIKMKVGRLPWKADIERIVQLRNRVGGDVEIRLDVGGGWDLETAEKCFNELEKLNVAWVEQPLPAEDIEGLKALKVRFPLKIAVDETLSLVNGLQRVIEEKAADVVVLKPMFLGGIQRTYQFASQAKEAGLEVVLTNALESAVGRMGCIHTAARMPGVHGLGSVIRRDVSWFPPVTGDGILLSSLPGLGLNLPQSSPHDLVVHRKGAGQNRYSGLNRENERGLLGAGDIPNPIESNAIARPEQVALQCGGDRITNRELAGQTARCAGGLKALGVKAGDRVALLGPRDTAWIVALHAIGWIGATAVPLPEDVPGKVLQDILKRTQPQLVVRTQEGLPEGEPTPAIWWDMDAVRLVALSSGTTGRGFKPVFVTTRQLLFSAFGSALRLGHHLDDLWLCCLPLHHIAGLSMIYRCAVNGIVLELHPQFQAEPVSKAMDSGRVTLVSMVPQMLQSVLDVRNNSPFPPQLRVILVGGGPISKELFARCRQHSLPVSLTWGMTESASQVATRLPGDLTSPNDVGAPISFARVETAGDQLMVRGPIVSGTYLTDDLGEVDEKGRVRILGRQDTLIISGGEKVDPLEVEKVLCTHEQIVSAVVFPCVSQRWGERPMALCVSRTEGERLTDEQIKVWCMAQMPSYKVPDRLLWVESIPVNEMKKISRRLLGRVLDKICRGDTTRLLGSGDEAQFLEAVDNEIRRGGRREGLAVDERVDQACGGVKLPVGVGEPEGEGDAFLGQALDLKGDSESISHSSGALVVGFGVNERHSEAVVVELSDVVDDGSHQLFKGPVTILKDTTEEDDSASVNLIETSSNLVSERHGNQ